MKTNLINIELKKQYLIRFATNVYKGEISILSRYKDSK